MQLSTELKIEQMKRDQAVVNTAYEDQLRVGEWFSKHPRTARILGRFATKFLEIHNEKLVAENAEPAAQVQREIPTQADFDAMYTSGAIHAFDERIAAVPAMATAQPVEQMPLPAPDRELVSAA